MLVAVLNSNFWLATHVTTITIGYGASLFAGLLGHIYLLQLIRIPFDKKYLNTVNANLFGATLFALFFTLFGTILGGIWADQSWGRILMFSGMLTYITLKRPRNRTNCSTGDSLSFRED